MRITEKTLVVLLIFTFFSRIDAAGQDSEATRPVHLRKIYRSFIAPSVFMGAALFVKVEHHLNLSIRDKRNESLTGFHTHADDFLQYTPIVAVYGLNIAGVKGANNFGNSMAMLIKSEILMTAINTSLKNLTNVTRPDGSAANSFPSGHTAQAFVAATFLHKEFGEKSVWYSIGAYTCATAVGTLRILNNRHWLSDVLMGAGIGIASTNVVYYTHRYKWSKKKSQIVLVPTYGTGPGVYFAYKFK